MEQGCRLFTKANKNKLKEMTSRTHLRPTGRGIYFFLICIYLNEEEEEKKEIRPFVLFKCAWTVHSIKSETARFVADGTKSVYEYINGFRSSNHVSGGT